MTPDIRPSTTQGLYPTSFGMHPAYQRIQEPMEPAVRMAAKSQHTTEAKDPFREGSARYLGYINEVAEAFHKFVGPAYGIVGMYAAADSLHKGLKGYISSQGQPEKTRQAEAYDKALEAGLFQLGASVYVPAKIVQVTRTLTEKLLKQKQASANVIRHVPTMAGLAVIPVIIHPIDAATNWSLKKFYRPLANMVKRQVAPEVHTVVLPASPKFTAMKPKAPVQRSELFYTMFS